MYFIKLAATHRNWILSTIFIVSLLALAAASVYFYRKRTLKVQEEPRIAMQEVRVDEQTTKNMDDDTCEANYCEIENINIDNVYINAPGEKKVELVEMENEYTCVI